MTDERLKCPHCEKDYGSRAGLVHHIGTQHAPDVPSKESTEPGLAAEPDEVEAPPETPASQEAIPAKPGILQRIRSRSRRGRGHDGHVVPASAERAPRGARRRVGRRVALDSDISDIWAFAGRRLERTPHYPTGRMLEYQAPAAGVIIDRAVAGTLPDRIVFQPLARNRSKYEDVGFLLAGPLLTFSITTTMGQMQAAADDGDQDTFNDLAARLTAQREMFSWVLSMMLPRLAAGAKLAADKKAKRDAVIADAFPELGGDDPVEVLVTMLFQPPSFEEATQNGKPTDGTTADVGQQNTVQFGD
jgi:hypothetical protein